MTSRHDLANGRHRARSMLLVLLSTLVAVAVLGSITSVAAAPKPSGTTDTSKGGKKTTTTTSTTSSSTTSTTTSSTTTSTSTTSTTAAPTTTTTTTTTTTAPTSSTAPVPLRRAALRMTVQTTSDWVQVELPGVSAGHVVRSTSGLSSVQSTTKGISVKGTAGVSGAAVVDVVTEVPETVTQGWMVLKQGSAGSTTVEVENRTATPFLAETLSTGGATTSLTKAVDAVALMGSTQLEWARADDRRRVLAFTYPWFDGDTLNDPTVSVHPTTEWRSWSDTDALHAAELARASGIDGFVMSWAGGQKNGLALHQNLMAAEATGGTATILLETGMAGTIAVAEQWITEALRQADSPAFQRHGGVPVIFVFEAYRIPNYEWRGIRERLAAAGTPVELVTDSWNLPDGPIAGLYRYNAMLDSPTDPTTTSELNEWNRSASRALRARATLGVGEPDLVVATAQPGWDDRPLRGDDRLYIDRADGKTYASTWEAALGAEADWVVITSWNEWYEGTGIAPSVEYGNTALDATAVWAEKFRNS